jgi:uncharacterized protein YndB with AHSA1/START domain
MAIVNVEYSTEIQATADKVWDILADVEAWPKWQGTSFIEVKTPTPIKEGSVFDVKLAGLKWNITMTKAEKPEKFAWIGKALGMRGNHEWDFREHEGKTLATTRESVSGWVAIPLYLVARMNAQRLNKQWLADLKARAESN